MYKIINATSTTPGARPKMDRLRNTGFKPVTAVSTARRANH